MNTENKLNKLSEMIIGSAINIHRELGPGLNHYLTYVVNKKFRWK